MRFAIPLTLLVVAAALPVRAQQTQARSARPLSLDEALDLAGRESELVGLARSGLAQAEGERRPAPRADNPHHTRAAADA